MLLRRVRWMGRRVGVVLHLFDEQHWAIRGTGFLLSVDVRYEFFIEYDILGLRPCGLVDMIRGKVLILNFGSW
jgi:hypothetical protein